MISWASSAPKPCRHPRDGCRRRRSRPGGELLLEWSHFGHQRLRDPFFEGSVQRCRHKPFNRLFHHCTPITALSEWLKDRPALRPSGLIFHMSRCGSTLVSGMLASLDHNLVISEAAPIDAVVRAPDADPGLDRASHSGWRAASRCARSAAVWRNEFLRQTGLLARARAAAVPRDVSRTCPGSSCAATRSKCWCPGLQDAPESK